MWTQSQYMALVTLCWQNIPFTLMGCGGERCCWVNMTERWVWSWPIHHSVLILFVTAETWSHICQIRWDKSMKWWRDSKPFFFFFACLEIYLYSNFLLSSAIKTKQCQRGDSAFLVTLGTVQEMEQKPNNSMGKSQWRNAKFQFALALEHSNRGNPIWSISSCLCSSLLSVAILWYFKHITTNKQIIKSHPSIQVLRKCCFIVLSH